MHRTILGLILFAGAMHACSDDRSLASLPYSGGGTKGGGTGGKDASDDGAAGGGGTAGSGGDVTDASYDAYPVDGSACGAVVANHPIAESPHVPVCSFIAWDTNPPSSGPHYPVWAAYTNYDYLIPRGFWVHCLEHGGVVLSYNCPGPSGCASEIAAAEAMIAALPVDPLCGEVAPLRRVVLVPDPLLDVKWAASAWGWTLKASCFEAGVFSEFYLDHFGQGPEATCGEGTLIGSDAGLLVPGNCGSEDAGVFDAGGD